jgi:hypothetical protein
VVYPKDSLREVSESRSTKARELMKMQPHITRRIVRNVLISLLIYALPVLLMLATFYFTGQRPWQNKASKSASTSLNK